MKKITLFVLLLCFVFVIPAAAALVESTLEADQLNYNVKTKAAKAEGNVVYTRGKEVKDIIKGDHAEGFTDQYIIVTGNPVNIDSQTYDAKLMAKKIIWTLDKTDKTNGYYEAFDTVRVKRTNGDFLNAAYVKVYPEAYIYDATGNVEGLYEGKYVKALEIHRNGENFSGKNVVRFEDRNKKQAISAAVIVGKINEKGEITEAMADKNVVFDNIDKNGLQSRLYGDHAVYSKAKGTLIVTGNAHGLRSDGKKLSADKLIYHEKNEQIEAIGRTKITFINNK